MADQLITDQILPSARLLGIKFDLLAGDDMEKYSNVNVNDASDLTGTKLGLPNASSQCTTCGSTNIRYCEGHFGAIKLPATIYHPHLVHEVVQILNQICPGCKSIKKEIKKDLQIKKRILSLQRLLLKMKFEKLKLQQPYNLSSHVADVRIKHLKISGLNKKWAVSEEAGCKYCLRNSCEWYPTIKFKVLVKDTQGKKSMAIIAEVNEKPPRKFRNRSLSEVLPKDFWSFVPMVPGQHGNSESMDISRLMLCPAQVFYLLRELDPEFIKLFVPRRESIFLSCIPVSPNCQRVVETSHVHTDGPRLSTNRDKGTKAYKAVVDASRKINEFYQHQHQHQHQQFGSVVASHVASRVQDCINVSKLHANNTSLEDHPSYPLKKPDRAACTGLRWIKEVVLSKRSDKAFRMTMIGDPRIRMGEIGLPQDIAKRLCIAENVNARNVEKLKSICESQLRSRDVLRARRKEKLTVLCDPDQLQIGDMFDRPLENGDIILVNRPPSVHQHSLLALSVRVLPIRSVVSINPLCCAPLLGDFDGDCLHGYVPQSVCARVELSELVSLDHQLFNGQSGQSLLSLTHDSLTAAHLLREGDELFSKFEMQQFQMMCPHQSQYHSISNDLDIQSGPWTGQQLFDMLLSDNTDISAGSSMTKVSKGDIIRSTGASSSSQHGISEIISRLFKRHGRKALNYLFSAQEVLCEYLTVRGLSVSLCDIYLTSDHCTRNKLMDEVRYSLEEAKCSFHFNELLLNPEMGLLLKEHDEADDVSHCMNISDLTQGPRPITPASVTKFKEFFSELRNVIHDYARKEENTLLSMIHAGSKGSLLKLVQQCACLGLQLSLKPLPFSIPVKHSCAEWNQHKAFDPSARIEDGSSEGQNSYAVIEASFLDGLSPLECFIHALTCRSNMFSENAELPGTLTRKIMFHMRDIYLAYDGTVRNAYGQQLVQFSYSSPDKETHRECEASQFFPEEDSECSRLCGEPVGSLAACSISEAAYGALDHPVNSLESSPLLELKKTLECAPPRTSLDRTASLYLSSKLKRLNYGLEYGALAVKNHLDRVSFSDIVTSVMIFYETPKVEETKVMKVSPWVTHFHVNKKTMMRKRINISSILDVLNRKYNLERQKDRALPKLFFTKKNCVLDNEHMGLEEHCIRAAVDDSDSQMLLDTIRDSVIPVILHLLLKGFTDFKQVKILWDSQLVPDGQIFLKVSMAEGCSSRKFWRAVRNACIPIMDLIDWEKSHPDGVYDISDAFGIVSAQKYFLKSLKSAVSEIGRNVHLEHLLLVSNSLSVTGEFHGLSVKGLKQQRANLSISSPFTQACFSNPEKCFIEAAKQGSLDHMSGTIDAISWGQEAQVGTGGPFEIMYSGKVHIQSQNVNIYETLLGLGHDRSCNKPCLTTGNEQEGQTSVANTIQNMRRLNNYDFVTKRKRFFSDKSPSSRIGSWSSIENMVSSLRNILYQYSINDHLNEADKSLLLEALTYHPNKDAKIGIGIKDIKIGNAPSHPESRCFILIRNDGTTEDFSYHKCIIGAANPDIH